MSVIVIVILSLSLCILSFCLCHSAFSPSLLLSFSHSLSSFSSSLLLSFSRSVISPQKQLTDLVQSDELKAESSKQAASLAAARAHTERLHQELSAASSLVVQGWETSCPDCLQTVFDDAKEQAAAGGRPFDHPTPTAWLASLSPPLRFFMHRRVAALDRSHEQHWAC